MAWRVEGRCRRAEGVQARVVTTDLNALLTALYVWIDVYLGPRTRPADGPD
jgi:hypothetical protein